MPLPQSYRGLGAGEGGEGQAMRFLKPHEGPRGPGQRAVGWTNLWMPSPFYGRVSQSPRADMACSLPTGLCLPNTLPKHTCYLTHPIPPHPPQDLMGKHPGWNLEALALAGSPSPARVFMCLTYNDSFLWV